MVFTVFGTVICRPKTDARAKGVDFEAPAWRTPVAETRSADSSSERGGSRLI